MTQPTAQGTIEYLVIMGIVIVIGLIVVGMTSTFLDSSSGVSGNLGKINALTGPISISETAVNSSGDGYIILKNNSGSSLTITKITLGGVEKQYPNIYSTGNTQIFSLTSVESGCDCSGKEGQTISCELRINYISDEGISNATKSINVPVNCESNSTVTKNAIEPLDVSAPVTSLSFSQGSTDYKYDFTYTATDDINLVGCTLKIDNETVATGDSNSYSATFLTEGNHDYNLTCVDSRNSDTNSGTISISSNYLITNCTELSNIANDLSGDYYIAQSFSCSGFTWDSIGDWDNKFSGTLNGQEYEISNLRINTPTNNDPIGMFEYSDGATIQNVRLISIDYDTKITAGGLVGRSYNTLIKNNYVQGTIDSEYYYVGGIAGYADNGTIVLGNHTNMTITAWAYHGGLLGMAVGTSKVLNNYSEGTINCTGTCGGLIGWSMDNAIIKYNYSKATINGTPNSGGLIGLSERYAIITDNFAVGSVLNTGQKINGFIGHDQFSTTINNNYWDTYLTGQSTCYYWGTCTPGCYDTNSGCVATSNAASSYYGLTGIPFSALNFDGNWVAQTNDYPKLYWEN